MISRLRQAIGRQLAARSGRIQVLYDGDCGLCYRTMLFFQGLDPFGQLQWIDFRTTPVNLDPKRLNHEMAAMSRKGVSFGFSAYRTIAWRVPLFWPLLPILYLPGLRVLGDAAYRQVADRRHATCRIDRKIARHHD